MLHTAWPFCDFCDFCGTINKTCFCGNLKLCAVGAVADIHLIFVFQVREGGEVEVGDTAGDGFFVGGIDEGHAAALETGAGETTAIDAVGLGHDLVKADLLGGS